ncbi:MAG: DUF3179 domain-containing protein [Haloarculaceae archaeon]
MDAFSRRRFLAAAGLAALAGCTGGNGGDGGNGDGGDGGDGGNGGNGDGGDGGDGTSDPPTTATSGAGGADSGTTSADGAGTDVSTALPLADATLPLPGAPADLRDAARSGGPPKDGIPSIDDPQFVAADAADYLDPGDPVFGVARDGVVKAYPQKILVWHEIVNDHLGDRPVSVTYCPLTGTVLGFERGDTTFGVSGRLLNNNLIMYDRATEAWWPQVLGTTIAGPWNGAPGQHSLRQFRLVWTTWEQWRETNPETRVLSTNTGHAKNYGRDPYGSYNPRGGYYDSGGPLFTALNDDDRYEPKTVFLGARSPAGAVAFRKDRLREAGSLTGDLGDTPVVAVHDRRYDTGYTYRNPDGLALERDGEEVVVGDERHAPDEVPLDRVHTFDAMWFAWAGFYPETEVYA